MKMIKPLGMKTLMYSILFIMLASCSSIPLLQPHATQVVTGENWKDIRESFTYSLGTVSVEADLNKAAIQGNAVKGMELLLNELNAEYTGSGECRIDIGLREADFMKDYQPVKTLALTMTVVDLSGKQIASYFYSVESKDSFYSSAYLYKRLKKGFGKLF